MVRISMDGAVLSHLTKIADAVSDEICIKINEELMKVIAIDPSLVSAAYVTIDGTMLQEYEVDEPLEVGLTVQELKKFSRFVKTKDIVTLEYLASEGALKFSVHGIKYVMPIITVDESRKRELNFEYNNYAVLSAAELSKAIQLAKAVSKIVSSTIKIKISPEGLIIESKGEGARSVRFEKPATELNDLNASETVSGEFLVDHLEKIIKAVKESTLVTVKLETGGPLCLEFEVKGGTGKVTYYQAPFASEE